jgi:hypothetical protein
VLRHSCAIAPPVMACVAVSLPMPMPPSELFAKPERFWDAHAGIRTPPTVRDEDTSSSSSLDHDEELSSSVSSSDGDSPPRRSREASERVKCAVVDGRHVARRSAQDIRKHYASKLGICDNKKLGAPAVSGWCISRSST